MACAVVCVIARAMQLFWRLPRHGWLHEAGWDRQTFSSASLAHMRMISSALNTHCTSPASRPGWRDAACTTTVALRKLRRSPPVSSA